MIRNYEQRARAIRENAKDANEADVRELTLFCMNTSEVYFRHVEPTIRSLEKHARKDDYTDDAALVAWKNCADMCAREYAKLYAGEGWNFSVADRCSAALELCEQNRENVWYEIRKEKENENA